MAEARRLPWLVLCLAACGGGGGEPDVGLEVGPDDAAPDDAGDVPDTGPDYLERIEVESDYAGLEAEGREVKYLAVVDGRERPLPQECLFQNTRRFPYHIQFLRAVFPDEFGELGMDAYTDLVLRRATRRWWGGELKRYARITHPLSGRPGIAVYTVYQERGPDENLEVEELVEVDRRLKACAPLLASELVLVPSGAEQEDHVRPLVPELNARGVAVRFPVELIERDYEAYSVGESYGYLSVTPRGARPPEEYGPRDILVLELAPTDVTTLGGMLTALPQNVHSHANLRLREKGLPNAMLAGAYEDSRIAALADRLVHLVTGESSLALEAASLADAERWWEEHRPTVGPVRSDLTVTAFAGFDALDSTDAPAYGAKAANLGELHGILPPEHRVEGFGVPFRAYVEFIAHNGLDAGIAALLADPRVYTDRAYRGARLDDLRDRIRDGAFAPGFFETLTTRLREVFGADATYVRFRSSTNAEDLEAFSGAGLYDSRTGCLADDLDGDAFGPSRCLSAAHRAHLEAELARRRTEQAAHPERWWLADLVADLEQDLIEEKTVFDAVRKVWRSLWNLRAFDEREYYGIDHAQVFMGLAVQAAFVMERQEAVAITNLRPDAGDPLYRIVTQLGEVGVVRPSDPTAVAETLTLRRSAAGAADVRLLVPSSLSPDGARLWSDPELETLSGLLFLVHDHFAAHVYPVPADLRLDLEVEVTADDRIVVKQARPYLGLEP
ncbi:MAG: hypothetical protein JXB32_12770 [Deltaproteobacteria bacterium]|nr:hypothetical protein [Deltaproteobacteria bacterium]